MNHEILHALYREWINAILENEEDFTEEELETAYRTALENLKIHHEDAYHDYFFQGISDCIEDVSTPEITDEYADYFEKEAYPETLEAQQEFLNGIDNFCNWNIDFREKLLRFQFNDGGSKKFRIVPVGSFSKITNTWLWEWGNNDTDASGELSKLREFWMKREFGLLTQRKWFSDVQTSAQMTTIAFYNLGGVGYYVGETENAFTCVIVKEKIV